MTHLSTSSWGEARGYRDSQGLNPADNHRDLPELLDQTITMFICSMQSSDFIDICNIFVLYNTYKPNAYTIVSSLLGLGSHQRGQHSIARPSSNAGLPNNMQQCMKYYPLNASRDQAVRKIRSCGKQATQGRLPIAPRCKKPGAFGYPEKGIHPWRARRDPPGNPSLRKRPIKPSLLAYPKLLAANQAGRYGGRKQAPG